MANSFELGNHLLGTEYGLGYCWAIHLSDIKPSLDIDPHRERPPREARIMNQNAG